MQPKRLLRITSSGAFCQKPSNLTKCYGRQMKTCPLITSRRRTILPLPSSPQRTHFVRLDEPKVHTPVAIQVPSLGATISPDGQQVHSLVANQVPSLGATISLDEQQDHNQVANQVPSPGATISPNDTQSTSEWQPTTPTLATVQPTPIVSIPSPKWIHPMTLPFTNDKVWPTNLIHIIHAIKIPPPPPTTNPN
jgi:hypothetical protein